MGKARLKLPAMLRLSWLPLSMNTAPPACCAWRSSSLSSRIDPAHTHANSPSEPYVPAAWHRHPPARCRQAPLELPA